MLDHIDGNELQLLLFLLWPDVAGLATTNTSVVGLFACGHDDAPQTVGITVMG